MGMATCSAMVESDSRCWPRKPFLWRWSRDRAIKERSRSGYQEREFTLERFCAEVGACFGPKAGVSV